MPSTIVHPPTAVRRGLAAAAVALAVLAARPAAACDICSVYTLLEARESARGLFAGLAEQYTDFSTLQLDGHEVENDAGQALHSSITQVVVGYQVNRRFGVQANVPLIHRSYRRPEAGVTERGAVSGPGDVSVIARWRVLERYRGDGVVVLTLLGGAKLPTGDSARLGEELEEGAPAGDGAAATTAGHLGVVGAPHAGEDHAASGVHGHDLALGSGSVDALLGGNAFWSQGRLFTRAGLQVALRSEGDFSYRFANDLTWNVVPGILVVLAHDHTLSVGLAVSGEHKGEDSQAGERLDDTGIDALYAGPSVAYSRQGRLYAELAVDLPLRQDNSGLQVVPDSRLRMALTWRF